MSDDASDPPPVGEKPFYQYEVFKVALDLGWHARLLGYPESANPFPARSLAALSWDLGWTAYGAEQDAKAGEPAPDRSEDDA